MDAVGGTFIESVGGILSDAVNGAREKPVELNKKPVRSTPSRVEVAPVTQGNTEPSKEQKEESKKRFK